jgi:membrane-anchored protein YejM (alkaline phosphatase superfamily)
VIDGPRFSETFGDSSYTYIPKMGRELTKEGVLFYNFKNNGPTYTNAGHTAITTGHYQKISNGGKELPKKPSIFNYYLKTFNADKSDAYVVSSKGKLEILANTKNKKWWNTYMPMTYCGEKGNSSNYIHDQQTFDKVNSLIDTQMPRIMLVNFLAVDSYGHSNQWEMYLSSIQKCDQYVYTIWNKIQNSPTLRNKTTLFVTNDHGRHLNGHKDGFVNHGDRCEGCKHISLLAIGPDFKKNQVIKEGGELIDISKTIAHMMGFEMPTSEGRVLTELFVD